MTKQTCPCTDCPKVGDVFVCAATPPCGMTLLIVKDCCCADPACVSLACCGVAMAKANG